MSRHANAGFVRPGTLPKGLSGEQIRKPFPKVGQSISQFVQKHGASAMLRRTGKARSTRWFVKE
jgi:hypothetical protein